jgi:broad specificity phosphatase PhoE
MKHTITLHFVRHGETTYNAERRIQGQMHEVALSDRGRDQAAGIAEQLALTGATLIHASDLLRTMQTARIIGERIGAPIVETPALRELHFGIAQGRLYDDVAELVKDWRMPDNRIEGGETFREMHARVGAFIEALRREPPAREIVVVTHGGTMNAALAYVAGVSVDEMQWRRFDNCALETVTVDVQATPSPSTK